VFIKNFKTCYESVKIASLRILILAQRIPNIACHASARKKHKKFAKFEFSGFQMLPSSAAQAIVANLRVHEGGS
jgi:hypothetical protein